MVTASANETTHREVFEGARSHDAKGSETQVPHPQMKTRHARARWQADYYEEAVMPQAPSPSRSMPQAYIRHEAFLSTDGIVPQQVAEGKDASIPRVQCKNEDRLAGRQVTRGGSDRGHTHRAKRASR